MALGFFNLARFRMFVVRCDLQLFCVCMCVCVRSPLPSNAWGDGWVCSLLQIDVF